MTISNAQRPLPNTLFIVGEARDIASESMEGFEMLRNLYHAIAQAPDVPSVIKGLARIGDSIVHDYHNSMDCQREDMEELEGRIRKEAPVL
ncbi:hypothetical protein ACJJH9_04095 [Microbulbifer sp. DLAB2-AF]|uniref:hypothetical protein n=1 Tax=unclassified Microbulbifer TaxID=2619833 RepID=UPI0040397BD8